jgi:hypothetical protein
LDILKIYLQPIVYNYDSQKDEILASLPCLINQENNIITIIFNNLFSFKALSSNLMVKLFLLIESVESETFIIYLSKTNKDYCK